MDTLKAPYIKDIETLDDNLLPEKMRTEVLPTAVNCVNWQEYPYTPDVKLRIAWSEKAMALMFEVKEDHIKAVAMEDNGKVWEDSCVEFFVGNPNGEGYFNFEMNCIGTLLAAKRTSRHDAAHFPIEKTAQVRRLTSLRHTPTDSRSKDQEWWAIEVIPFELIGLDEAPERLKANFYKCGDLCDTPHFLSWAPIGTPQPDFHRPESFQEVELCKKI